MGAQQQLDAALAEFLRLPQKLKAVFDLTKTLSSDISGLVPASLLHQAETQAAAARHAEQQHLFHVEMLQRRLQALTMQGGVPSTAGSPGGEAGDKGPGHDFAGGEG